MNDEQSNTGLMIMTAEIVATYVANNAVRTSEVGGLIGSVYASLSTLGEVSDQPAAETKPMGAVSSRKSLSNPAHILSMIDGKPYKMLTRHLRAHGYTPASYRAAFNLAPNYPVVAPDYADMRRKTAHKIGLGRKPDRAESSAEQPSQASAGRKPKSAEEAPPAAPARRGRPPKALSAAIAAAKGHLGGE